MSWGRDALLYSREVASGEDVEEGCLAACTVAAEVAYISIPVLLSAFARDCVRTYRSTSFRCTVLLPPQSGILRRPNALTPL